MSGGHTEADVLRPLRLPLSSIQAQLEEYVRRLDEAERNMRTAEAKIAERDQRIIEVERLLDCMTQVRIRSHSCQCESAVDV